MVIFFSKFKFSQFQKSFEYFERAKIHGKLSKVADGLNLPALFNMKNVLKGLASYFSQNHELMDAGVFYKIALSGFAKPKDTKLHFKQIEKIEAFQRQYYKLFQLVAKKSIIEKIFSEAHQRTQLIHKENLITGNAVIEVVNEVLAARKKYLQNDKIQNIIDKMVFSYLGTPEVNTSSFYREVVQPQVPEKIFNKILELVQEHKEDI